MTVNNTQYSIALYKTGWFYLIIAVWCGLYWLVSQFGLTQINAVQQTLLSQLFDLLGTETYFAVDDPRRLSQSYLLIYLPFIFNLVGLILIGKMIQLSRKLQSGLLIGYLSILLLINGYFYSQSQWIDVLPSIVGLLLTWLLMLLYQNENQLLQQALRHHNQLLAETIFSFNQNQQYDKIITHLNQTQPDIFLVDAVNRLIEQTKNINKSLTKDLRDWINLCEFEQNNKLKLKRSKLALAQSASSKKLDLKDSANQSKSTKTKRQSNETLDKTMVIKADDEKVLALNAQLFPVKNFGRYAVEGLLGKGAMGIVYQGVDPKINRHVAIKTLELNQEPGDTEFENRKKQFFREAETAGNLNHPNIVTIFDVGEEGDLGYIAMDLLTGAPLSEFVKPETRLPTPLVYHLVMQITEALDYAHQNNVVHRDIKPSNIIYDDELQKVTVTDFGIAFVTDQNKTHPNTIVGSPYYMSPEQITGNEVDGRSDIFSLGVTFYQLLTGYLPFEGNSLASVTHQIINAKQTAVSDWDPLLPPSASRITNKAMQKDVEKRYQTMEEFQFALSNALKRDFKKY